MFRKVQHGAVILGILLPLTSQALSCRGISEDDASVALCDASFINPPVFGDLCQNATEIGTYTLRNNTPAAFIINYIRIQNNDGLPDEAASPIPALINNCGSSLASGATCNISVELMPLAAGVFNRVLQVGINTRQVEIDAPAITATSGNCTTPGPIPGGGFTPTIPGTPLSLFRSSILAYSEVTNTGPTKVNGDLDLTPGSSVTGFPPGTIINGTINIDNMAATTTKTQAQAYFTSLNSLPCNFTYGAGTDLTTLSPMSCTGTVVRCFTSTALMTGPVVLNGVAGDSCVFRIASALTVSNNAVMTTAGGIFNDNISWAIGSSATLGTNSTLYGIIDAFASITIKTSATLKGRAWALNGAVTLDTNMVNPTLP
jgi:hypothetical protein